MHCKFQGRYIPKKSVLRHTLLLAAALVQWRLAPKAVGAETTWTNPAGGDWNSSSNWSAGVPTSAVDAVFALDATYTIALSSNAAGNNIIFRSGDTSVAIDAYVLSASSDLHIGDTAGSFSNTTISGSTGTLSIGNQLVIGTNGGGMLTQTGGTLKAQQFNLGLFAGGIGSYNMQGGSSAAAGDFNIGSLGGAGTLNLTSGQIAIAGTTRIGNSSSGLRIVDGTLITGSLDTTETDALSFGGGTIIINGGTFQPKQLAVTLNFSTTDFVTSQRSFVINSDAGSSARPTLWLRNGGSMVQNSGPNFRESSYFIGINGGQGAAIISDPGSSMQTSANTGFLWVGSGGTMVSGAYFGGNGSIAITNGGLVKINREIRIGESGGIGQGFVDGVVGGGPWATSSRLTATRDFLYVGGGRFGSAAGAQGQGSLTISNGGQVDVDGLATGYFGGTGRVVVDGVYRDGNLAIPSKLTITDDYSYIGVDRFGPANSLAGFGTLALTNGGQAASSSRMYVGSDGGSGWLVVDGVNRSGTPAIPSRIAIGNDSLNIAGFYYGNGGNGLQSSGTLVVTNGGQVSVGRAVYIGLEGGTAQAVFDGVDGTGSSAFASQLRIGPEGSLAVGMGRYTGALGAQGDGTLILTNGAQATGMSNTYIGSDDGGRGFVTVGRPDGNDAGNTLLSTGNLYLSQDSTTHFDAGGTLNIYKGGLVAITNALITYSIPVNLAATRINLAGGKLTATSITLENSNHLHWTAGTLSLNGGNALTSGSITVPNGGLLAGSGTISGLVNVTGTISPGANATTAEFALSNGVVIGSAQHAGTLATDIDINGNIADLLNSAGPVALSNADLHLTLHNSPDMLAMAKTFILVRKTSVGPVDGLFTDVVIDGSPGAPQYSIDYNFLGTAVNGIGDGNEIAVTFTAVPEPAQLGLITFGLLLSIRRHRTRRAHLQHSL